MHKLGTACTVWLLVACGGAKAVEPKPVAATTDLHADIETFCSAETAEHVAGGLPDLGPYLEPKLHDTEVKTILLGLKDGKTTISQAQVQIDAVIASEHIAACPTREKLFAPKT